MKSLFKSNVSWFMLLYLFEILLPYAMEENTTKTNSYSVNQLQNDFIGLKKNPQKYVKFQLNAENTTHPDAGGLYELLPYYQKINPLGEKANYAIQWCDFANKWKLIKVNPLGDFPRLDVEETTIAILLEGDQFSRPTNADIKAYTTYEQMKAVVKTVGEQNKELKMKIHEMEEEIAYVQTKANDEISSLREENEKLEETWAKIKKQNIKLKAFALEQNDIAKKENDQIKIQAEERQKILEELENLTSNLKEKEMQIEKKNKENWALEKEKGDLAYKLSDAKEFKQKFLSLEKETKPLKVLIKHCQEEISHLKENLIKIEKKNEENRALDIKNLSLADELNVKKHEEKFTSLEKEVRQLKGLIKYCQTQRNKSDEASKEWEIKVHELEDILNSQVAEVQILTKELNSCNDETEARRDIFRNYKHEKREKIKQIQSNWKKDMEESTESSIQQDIEKFDEKYEIRITKLKESYYAENKEFQEEIQELLDQQEEVINDQEKNINFKDLSIEFLLNLFQSRMDMIYPKFNTLKNSDPSKSSFQKE